MKKEKGVKKNVVKKDIFNQDYIDCLFEKRKSMHTIQTIQARYLKFKWLQLDSNPQPFGQSGQMVECSFTN